MIVFEVKGQSHRLSTLKSKEKNVIKIFSTYSTKYTEDTEALGRQLSQQDQSPIQLTVYSYPPDNHHSSDVVCCSGGGAIR